MHLSIFSVYGDEGKIRRFDVREVGCTSIWREEFIGFVVEYVKIV